MIELMETVAETLPGTMASVSCDLTKLHELTLRGSAAEVLAALRTNPKTEKGEYCLVLDFHGVELPSAPAPAAEVSLEAAWWRPCSRETSCVRPRLCWWRREKRKTR